MWDGSPCSAAINYHWLATVFGDLPCFWQFIMHLSCSRVRHTMDQRSTSGVLDASLPNLLYVTILARYVTYEFWIIEWTMWGCEQTWKWWSEVGVLLEGLDEEDQLQDECRSKQNVLADGMCVVVEKIYSWAEWGLRGSSSADVCIQVRAEDYPSKSIATQVLILPNLSVNHLHGSLPCLPNVREWWALSAYIVRYFIITPLSTPPQLLYFRCSFVEQ